MRASLVLADNFKHWKGAFPSNHPLALGNFGLGGNPRASEYLKSGVDLMVVLGTKISDMSLSGLTSFKGIPSSITHGGVPG